MHSIIFVWLLLVLFPSNFINCVFFYIQSYYFYYHFSVCFAVSKSSYRTIDLPVCLCVLLYVQCWRISAYTHLVQFGCLQPRERKECNKGATASSLKHNCARAHSHTHKIVVVLLIDFSYALGYSWSAASAKLLMHTRLRRAFFVSWIKSHLRCFLDVCSHTIYGLFTTPL